MRRRVVSIPLSPLPAEPEYDQVHAEAVRRSADRPRLVPLSWRADR